MREWQLTLPYPPSVNHLWRRSKHATYLSQQGKEYRTAVWDAVDQQGLRDEAIGERLAVDITLHPPTRAKFDLDNRLKALLDALMHAGLIVDDGQIDDLHIRRSTLIKGGCAVVRIRALT